MTSPRPHLHHVTITVKEHTEFKPKEPSPIPRLRHVKKKIQPTTPEFKPKEPSPIPRLRHVKKKAMNVNHSPKPKEPSPIPHLHHVKKTAKDIQYRNQASPKPHLRHIKSNKSGFTPKQRHEIIMKTLSSFNKTAKTFKAHWSEDSGEYLTQEILLKTPMFSFMKDKWSRSQIETLFYKARIVIDRKFDSALQECFGGNPGPRWKGGKGDGQKEQAKWKKGRHRFNTAKVLKKATKDYTKWTAPTDLKKVSHIDVECPNKDIVQLMVEMNDPLHYVKKQIEHKTHSKYPEKRQVLLLRNSKMIDAFKSLKQYGVVNGDKLTLSMGDIKVNIESHNGIRTEITVDRYQSVVALKSAIEKRIHPHITVTEQVLIFKGNDDTQFMDNDKLLVDYDINEGDVIYLGAPTTWRVPTDQNKYIINVECPDGQILEMFVVNQDIISYIKLGLQTLTDNKYEVNDQILYYKQNELIEDNDILKDIGVSKSDTLQLSIGDIAISIKTREEVVIDLMVNPHELVLNVKNMIQDETDGSYLVEDQQIFKKNDEELKENDKTLCNYGIVENDELYLGGNIMIKIKGNNGLSLDLSVDLKYYVETLKHIIFQNYNVSVEQQKLYADDIELDDDNTLLSYKISKGDVIDLEVIYTIFIQRKDAERIRLNVSADDEILDIKKQIYNQIKSVVISEAKDAESELAESELLKLNLKMLKKKCKSYRISFEGNKLDMISRILEKEDEKQKKEIGNLILKYNDDVLEDNNTIKECEIHHNGVLMLREIKPKVMKPIEEDKPRKRAESRKKLKKDCKLRIDLPNRKIIKLNVNLEFTLEDIKKQIETETSKYPVSKQILQFKKMKLEDDTLTLKTCGVKNDDTIDLSMEYITVYVEQNDGNRLELKIDSYAPFVAIKYQVDKRLYPRIPIREQNIYKTKERDKIEDNEYTDNDELLFDCNIYNGNTVYLGSPKRWRVPMSNDKYTISVQCIDGHTLPLFVTPQDIISYVKLQIQEQTDEKYHVNDQTLYYKGKELDDDNQSLEQLGIKRDNTLQLSVGDIPISIETQDKKVIELMVNPHEILLNIKNMIQNKTGGEYLVNDLQIFKKANDDESELKDNDKSLFNYGVFDKCKLYLGGKIKLKIKGNNGVITDINIDPKETISTLKHVIHFSTGIFVNQQTLYFKGFELTDHQTLKTYRIKRNDIIDLKVIFSIFVDNEDAQRRVTMEVSADESISTLKQRLVHKMSTPVDVAEQILKFNNNLLKDGDTMAQYDITQNCVIKLFSDRPKPLLKQQTVPITKRKHRKKRRKKRKKKHKKKKKKVHSLVDRDSWLMYENDDLPLNPAPKMSHRRSKSSGNILQKKVQIINPMGVDVNSVFDMTEIDDIVNNLDEYEQKLYDETPILDYDEYNEEEEDVSSESYHEEEMPKGDRDRASTLGLSRISLPVENPKTIKRESAIIREIEFDSVHDDEKKAFDNRRQMDMDDLMDGFFTDDDDDEEPEVNDLEDIKEEEDDEEEYEDEEEDEEEEEEEDAMTLSELLKMFGLKKNVALYKYYHNKLGIEFAKDLVNHIPCKITQPIQFKSTKLRIMLTRMSRFVSSKVSAAEWKGDKAKEWVELETTTVRRVFSPPVTPQFRSVEHPSTKFTYSSDICFENENGDKSNKITLYRCRECIVDKQIDLNTEYGVKVHLEELPDMDTKRKGDTINIGCHFYDGFGNKYETVYISDRCSIYRDPLYVNMLSLSNAKLMDTDSEIHITVNNTREEPTVTFAHFRNDRMHKYNEREIVLDQLQQPIGGYAKIFIQHSYGKGIYSIYEILKSKDEINNKPLDIEPRRNSL